MLCMVPINNIALGTLPPDRLKNASGLFNLTRNLGGAVGLALINTVLNNRMDLHLQRLRESVTWGSSPGDGDAQRPDHEVPGSRLGCAMRRRSRPCRTWCGARRW